VIGADLGARIAAGLLFAIAALALGTLFVFIRELGKTLWLLPFGAATQFLAELAILLFLFVRALTSPAQTIYGTLERDIVLDNLAPSEIRSRFIREALGPTLGDWFETLNQKYCDAVSKIIELTNSVKPRLEEIESIDSHYALERNGRAEKLRTELREGIAPQISEIRGITFQLKQVRETSPSTRDKEMLTRILQEWESGLAALGDSAHQVLTRLEALASPSK
jgi:hypothetical protein